MDLTAPIAASVLAALLAASPAVGQTVDEALPGPPSLPPIEGLEIAPETVPGAAPDSSEDGAAGDAAVRAQQAHLDALFARLADPENENWQGVQAQIYSAWSQSGSASMDLLAQRADRAMETQDLDVALSFLNDLVRLAPDHADGWNKRATVHFLREDYGRSLDDIARTLLLEPRHFGAYAGLGIILDRLGDKKGALEAYRRAAEIHPHLPGAAEGIRKLTREVEGERT